MVHDVGVVCSAVSKIFCLCVAVAYLVSVVEVVVCEDVEASESVVHACSYACVEREGLRHLLTPLEWYAASHVDAAVKAFAFVFL